MRARFYMKAAAGLLIACVLFSPGCRKRRVAVPESPPSTAAPVTEQPAVPVPSSPAAGGQSVGQTAPAATDSIPAQHFSTLSQALLTFRRDKKRAPKDWQELITTGYLKQMPAAPAGKRYTFNPASLDVRMVSQ